ncbi:papilin-like [Parasteatoda tepidariorum]|uniref:papilin-like n=1 Tax=Parasteatoda tepidariorum TaxID=114398 RepID=UPI0039BCC1CC
MCDSGGCRLLCTLVILFYCNTVVFPLTQTTLTNHRRLKRQIYSTKIRQPQTAVQNRTFVAQPQRIPEYGPWGPWTITSECSRSCGGGVYSQDRKCLDVRTDGNHSCMGQSRSYFFCNTEDCPQPATDFRVEQCATFNSIPYHGKLYNWVPYYNAAQNQCELNCMPLGGSFFVRLQPYVVDGTRCRNDGSLNVCVEGSCMPVGCDRVLGSTTKEDECRVCGGDGTSCKVVKGVFDQDKFTIGYNDILRIPIGATSILVQEVQHTTNYIAIRNSAGEFYLNGNWTIEYPREIKIAGTTFHYERKMNGSTAEILRAKGPTTELIFIVLLYQEKNLGISYKFSIPTPAKISSSDSYNWTFGDFGECSQSCGGGVQNRSVSCINSTGNVVEDNLCDPTLKPSTNDSCNTQPCPNSWYEGDWSPCSHSCANGTQFRFVFCQQTEERISVPEEECYLPKPPNKRECNVEINCNNSIAATTKISFPVFYNWTLGDFGECSQPCGGGVQYRTVSCIDSAGNAVEDNLCDPTLRPSVNGSCNTQPCQNSWHAGKWRTCVGGTQLRLVFCKHSKEGQFVPEKECYSPKPPFKRECNVEMNRNNTIAATTKVPFTVSYNWTLGDFGECSQPCGGGVQNRSVSCINSARNVVENNLCDPALRPSVNGSCNTQPCSHSWKIEEWGPCSNSCGGGYQHRLVYCRHTNEGHFVPDEECHSRKPPLKRECNVDIKCPEWTFTHWSKCSGKCGIGVQSRNVFCGAWKNNTVIKVDEVKCDASKKFTNRQNCSLEACKGSWLVSAWGRVCISPWNFN